jgi:hypothetical protein
MAQTAMSTSSVERAAHATGVERAAYSSISVARPASTGSGREFDDGLDRLFAPAAHPGRELFTFCLFILLVATVLTWGGWKLLSMI